MDIQKHKVLFLDITNSCVSQMAEALLNNMAGDLFEAHSAGTKPAIEIHPLTIQAMNDINIDISGQMPKSAGVHLDKDAIGFVIAVCEIDPKECSAISPSIPDSHRLFWHLTDPLHAVGSEDDRYEITLRVRNELKDKIQTFIEQTKLDPTV